MPGVITRLIPHYRQPQYAETINRANLITDGIVREFNAASIKDAASGFNTNIVGNIVKSAGTVGRSLDGAYQGSDHYIDLGRPALASNQVTLEALVLVNSFQETSAPYLSGILSSYHLSNAGPVLRFNNNATLGAAAVPTFILTTGNGATEYQTTGTALSTGRVYHILGTYDGTVATLYVDGNQVGQTSPAITFDYGSGSFFAGMSDYVNSSTTDNRCLNGKLFAGRIYSKSKTSQQVKLLANNPWQIYTPVKRRIYIAGQTSITSDLTVQWNTLNAVTSDSSLRWNILNAITSDVGLRWDIRSALTSDVSLQWNILNQILSDSSLQFNILSAVASDVALQWTIQSSLTPVTSDLGMQWNILSAISSDLSIQWNVISAVQSDITLQWTIEGISGSTPTVSLTPITGYVTVNVVTGYVSIVKIQ